MALIGINSAGYHICIRVWCRSRGLCHFWGKSYRMVLGREVCFTHYRGTSYTPGASPRRLDWPRNQTGERCAHLIMVCCRFAMAFIRLYFCMRRCNILQRRTPEQAESPRFRYNKEQSGCASSRVCTMWFHGSICIFACDVCMAIMLSDTSPESWSDGSPVQLHHDYQLQTSLLQAASTSLTVLHSTIRCRCVLSWSRMTRDP